MEPSKAYNSKEVEDKIYRLWEKSVFFNLDFLKKIPIEVYVLMILPVLGSIWIIFFNPNSLSFKTFLFYLFFGGPELSIIIQILFFYFVTKLIFTVVLPILKFLMLKEKSKIKSVFIELKNTLKNYIYFFLLIIFGGFFLNISLDNLSSMSNSEKITWSSVLLTNWDNLLFGRDLLFWLNSFVNKINSVDLGYILIKSYDSLNIVITVFLLILLLKNKILVKKFIIFLFLIVYISMPIWYSMPTLAPIYMYIHNILETNAPERTTLQMKNYQPSSALYSFQNDVLDIYKKTGDFLPITAFPSMHAGWGFGIVIYGFLLYRPSIFVLLPWFFLQAIGAVYTGEHYAVDLFLGIIMAVIAYYLVELLFILEKRYHKGNGSFFIIDTIQEDFRKIFIFFKNIYNPWR